MTTQQLESFRSEVKLFLKRELDPVLCRRVLLGKALSKEELISWQQKLFQQGWVAPAWPQAYGGTGWTIEERWIFEEECAIAGAPPLIPMGLVTVGPILIAAGSKAQRSRYLPKILDGSEIWCQGFSEPGAGSDLAALSCTATKVKDGYHVNGSKIWTTQAHWSDWCLLLARTSSEDRKQAGISLLILDMHSPGVTVQPILTLDGLHVLNQVFFDDVFVPVENRVGDEGQAWSVLKSNIGHERILNANPGFAKALKERLLELARRPDQGGRRPLDNPRIRNRIVLLDVRLRALETTALRVLDLPNLPVTPEASLLKIRGTELQQDYTRLIGEVLGDASLPYDVDWLRSAQADEGGLYDAITPNYLFLRKASISAGTNEVQRDIIARQVMK
jgi:alkylation response protein AidB-like acyl-CoA dehydrogenase